MTALARARLAVALLPVGLLLSVACSRDNTSDTGIIVEVSSDLRVPQDIDQVQLTATDPQGNQLYLNTFDLGEGPNRFKLPFRTGLYPLRDTATPIHVVAVGQLSTVGQPVASRSATLSFVHGKKVVLPLPLLAVCKGVACKDASLTCQANGQCDSDTVSSKNLPTYVPNQPVPATDAATLIPDAQMPVLPMDAAVDKSVDSAADRASDLAPEVAGDRDAFFAAGGAGGTDAPSDAGGAMGTDAGPIAFDARSEAGDAPVVDAPPDVPVGGSGGSGGTTTTGGITASGGKTSAGGTTTSGGMTATGGSMGGIPTSGGTTTSGGATSSGGAAPGGGAPSGGSTAVGGSASGGASAGGTTSTGTTCPIIWDWESTTADGWVADTDVTLAVSTTQKFTGTQSLKATIPALTSAAGVDGGAAATTAVRTIDITPLTATSNMWPGAMVTAHVWVPAGTTSLWMHLYIQSNNWANWDDTTGGTPTAGAWSTLTFTVPAAAVIYPGGINQFGIQLGVSGGGTFAGGDIFIDAITVCGGTQACSRTATGAFGFETADSTDGWAFKGDTGVTDTVVAQSTAQHYGTTGTGSLKVAMTAIPVAPSATGWTTRQVELPNPQAYCGQIVTYHVMADNVTGLNVQPFASANGWAWFAGNGVALTAINTWTTVTFTLPATINFLGLQAMGLQLSNTSTTAAYTGNVYIDEITWQ